MAYIRHRHRMIRQSVFQDLKQTLISLDWMLDPDDPSSTLLPLLGSTPVNLIDYFPESEQIEGDKLPLNTLAIDVGVPNEAILWELGGNLYTQEYAFNLAFYGASDAVAIALMNDLNDRYEGFSPTTIPSVQLYNYLETPPTEVVRMGVEAFRFDRDTESIAPAERYLYFAELTLTDYLEL